MARLTRNATDEEVFERSKPISSGIVLRCFGHRLARLPALRSTDFSGRQSARHTFSRVPDNVQMASIEFANLLQFSECMGDSDFKIDLTETFPHLNNAPIVEAVIEVRTRAEAPWEESTVTQRFKAQLPEYPSVLSINA